jgi:hypothetical protein
VTSFTQQAECFYCISLLFQCLRTNSCKGESETSESDHSHGSKASCDEETYGDSHSSENSVEKKKSNLEKLIFVDNKCKL